MTIPTNPQAPFSPFLPTTVNFPEEEDRLRVFLINLFANYADVINDKKIGMYSQSAENQNGNKFFYDTTKKTRNGYEWLSRVVQYPNAGSITVFPPNDINPQFVVTNVWGSASKPCTSVGAGDGDYFSFYSEGNSKVTFTMSDTQIVITTTVDMTAYSGFIIIEYVRNGT